MPWANGLSVFLLVEFAYGLSINNLEASFLPAAVVGGIVFLVSAYYQSQVSAELESPPPEPYRAKFSRVFGTTKEVLVSCYDAPEGWRIAHEQSDQGYGSLQAYITLKDDSFRNMRWLVPQGIINKRVNLNMSMEPLKDGSTRLRISYTVLCPFPASRHDCDDIIRHTTSEISGALRDLEIEKHG